MKSVYAKAVFLAVLLAALAGCSREGENKAAVELAKARSAVVAQMAAMVEAKKKELGTDDETVLKAALEKDPEWRDLYARCQDANAAIGENRKETMAVVRERLTRTK